MPFDMGFNFRNQAGFVTDQAFAVSVKDSDPIYPNTFTNGNGVSVNAGWVSSTNGTQDRAAGNDPRIAGIAYRPNDGSEELFKVDLSSGSAPGAGTYLVDVAMGGETSSATDNSFKVLDNTTVMIDGTNSGAGYDINSGDFIDATLATVTASTTWTGTQTPIIFASITAQIGIGYVNSSDNTLLAHFRLTFVPPPDTIIPFLSVIPLQIPRHRREGSALFKMLEPFVPAAVTSFRKTLSRLGTRTGGRQTHA